MLSPTSTTSAAGSTANVTTTYTTREYPVAYSFDAQGRMTNMTTWQNFTAGTGAAKTRWIYNASRGWLDGKRYDNNLGPDYTYTASGRLKTRVWARGVTTTYTNNAAGDLVGIGYSDGTTANVVFNLDRLGRRTNIVDGAGSHFLFYDANGRLLMETNSSGTLAGWAVTQAYDSLLRRNDLKVLQGTTAKVDHDFSYDAASRLLTAGQGAFSATYTYLANSPLISQVLFKSNTTVRLTTTKQYDKLNRLLNITSLPGASGASPFASTYLHNDANQRIRNAKADGSAWSYEYDPLGQVTHAKRRWSDGVLGRGNGVKSVLLTYVPA